MSAPAWPVVSTVSIRLTPARVRLLQVATAHPMGWVVGPSAEIMALADAGLVEDWGYPRRVGHWRAAITDRGRARLRCEDYRERPGWRSTHIPDATGLPVSVYDQDPTKTRPGAPRWWVVCETHGAMAGYATRGLAAQAAETPQGWCPTCRDLTAGTAR